MNLTAFALVVAAACRHALLNLAAKRMSGNVGVLWLGLSPTEVMLAPFALLSALQSFGPAVLPLIVATGLIHAAYSGLLAAGHRRGNCRSSTRYRGAQEPPGPPCSPGSLLRKASRLWGSSASARSAWGFCC